MSPRGTCVQLRGPTLSLLSLPQPPLGEGFLLAARSPALPAPAEHAQCAARGAPPELRSGFSAASGGGVTGARQTLTGRGGEGQGRGGANLGTGQSCLGALVSRKLSKPKPSQSGLCGRGPPMGAAGSSWLGPPCRLALLHLSPIPGRCAPNRFVRLQGIWQAGEGNRGSCPRLARCSSLPCEELGLCPCRDEELGVGICGAPQPSGQELPCHPTSPLARAKMRLVDRAPRLPH